MVVDAKGAPVPGIGVTVEAPEGVPDQERNTFEAAFARGETDPNGLFRIKFTLPIVKGRVDARGKLVYNKGWQRAEAEGKTAYQPITTRTGFRLVYERKSGTLLFAEESPRMVVVPILSQPAAPAPAGPW
ncbi:MAG: hypothetical protein HY922_14325 [Elusimicrobia bacterium]|nr:hypothetical protein [Elusimicrobiota bacterium]